MRAIHSFKAKKHVGLLHFTILTCLLVCNLSTTHAQNRTIDSLTNLIRNHPQEDDRKGTLLFEMSSQYFLIDPKKSTGYLDQLLAFKDKIKFKAIVASSYRAIGYTYYLRSMYRSFKVRQAVQVYCRYTCRLGFARVNLPGAIKFHTSLKRLFRGRADV